MTPLGQAEATSRLNCCVWGGWDGGADLGSCPTHTTPPQGTGALPRGLTSVTCGAWLGLLLRTLRSGPGGPGPCSHSSLWPWYLGCRLQTWGAGGRRQEALCLALLAPRAQT